MTSRALIWSVLAFASTLAACSKPSNQAVLMSENITVDSTEPAMGTEFRIVGSGAGFLTLTLAQEAAFARIREIEAKLSDYQEDSEVSQLAKLAESASPEDWFPVSETLAAVLGPALSIAEQTEGAFDPTLGRLTKLWRRAKRQGALPRADRLREAQEQSGYTKVEFNASEGAVRFLQPGIAFDFGGIAKGFAVDEAVRIMTEHGVPGVLVDGGGDLRVTGPMAGRKSWVIALEGASFDGQSELAVTHTAIATSGDRYQAVVIDGVRYGHILDPRTGLGLTQSRTASVEARSCMRADALASALCVLGDDFPVSLAGSGERYAVQDHKTFQGHRPNILFLLADDLGWADLGCTGSSSYRTPHLDALASHGLRFTDAYAAAANCAPTRATLMTGQSIPRHGVYTVGSGARGKKANRSVVPPPNRTEIPTEVVTLAESLQAAGYRTGHFGKWHLGGYQSPEGPLAQGFDVNVGGYHVGHPPKYFWPYHKKANDGSISQQLPGLEDGTEGEYLTDRLTTEALAFLDADDGRPWFLYFPFYSVHTPIQAPKEQVDAIRARGLEGRQQNPTYSAMVESMDRNCGRLFEWLEANDQVDNTLVIFTSDNGGYGGYLDAGVDQKDITHNHPLKGGKGMMAEGGIRVPLLIRWPARIREAGVLDTPVHTLDFYPTLVAAAGATAPPQELEGRDLAALWTEPEGESSEASKSWPERALYWHMPGYLEARKGSWRATPAGAIRRGPWKLIEPFDGKPIELYHLGDDLGERNNLAEQETEQRDSLLAALRSWREATGAPMPTPQE